MSEAPADIDPEFPARSRLPWFAALLAVVLASPGLWFGPDFPIDDAWIHLAYARSLRLGEGMSYNPGDWETGFSSPLWVLCLAPFASPKLAILGSKGLGLALHGATAWFATTAAQRLCTGGEVVTKAGTRTAAGLTTALLCALQPMLAAGATSGMEVGLTAAIVAALAVELTRSTARSTPLALLAALSLWARPEALFFHAGAGALLLVRRRGARVRSVVAMAGASAVALLLWVVYCTLTSGYPWPNTHYIKAGWGLSGLRYLGTTVLWLEPWLVSLVGPVMVGLLLRRASAQAPAVIALLVGWVAAITLIAASRPLHPGTGFYEWRYFAPFSVVPIILVGAAAGRRTPRVWVSALALMVAVSGSAWLDTTRANIRRQDDTLRLHTLPGRFLRDELPANARVAAEGAGATRFHARRSQRIIDLVGLNDREAAHLHHDRTGKLCHFISRDPTHLLIPEPWLPQFSPPFALHPVQVFEDPHYGQAGAEYPLRVLLLQVRGVDPSWSARCAERPPS